MEFYGEPVTRPQPTHLHTNFVMGVRPLHDHITKIIREYMHACPFHGHARPFYGPFTSSKKNTNMQSHLRI